jgi:hypothetical protein
MIETEPQIGPAPLPTVWTPDHVARRLVEAFRTLDKMPRPKGPRGAGNHWPQTRVEWADQLAQAELPEDERRARAEQRHALAFRPTGAEIAQMDKVLDWLRCLRQETAELALVLSLWAVRAARRRSVRAICREMGWTSSTFYYQRACALERISAELNRRATPVF